ncbi:choline-sulfatase [Deinococcus navajonensis]|uniref:Choline-sulfatase n=1 Tax=Deinococcus navajonensis TaxID=309884 RepID=A0ABV8XRM8_9DEIO
MTQPNMLMVMVDQMAHDVIGRLGHPVVQTPHLDRLTARGVAFTNAYCNSPICVSSRTSFMTGTLVRDNGAFDNGSEFPASLPTFVHQLNQVGYLTLLSGKMHFVGPDQRHGFQERLTSDISPASFDLTPDWARGPCANEGTSVNRLRYPPVRPWSLQMSYDDEVLHSALVRLRQLGADRQDGRAQPFFLCVSFSHPHDPFLVPQPWWDLYGGVTIPPPSAPGQALNAMHPYNQWIQVHHEADRFPLDEREITQARRAYYAAVSYVDQLVGQLLDELERLGLDDTLIVFTSDHGEMLGQHGMWFKRTFYDGAAKVPLILALPGVRHGACRAEVVSLLDLTATLLDYAGAPVRPAMGLPPAGQSLRPLLEDLALAWTGRAICEYFSEGTIEPMLMLRTARHKYVYVHRQAPLLFDLVEDPLEQIDLAGHPETAPLCRALQAELLGDLDVSQLRARIVDSQQQRLLVLAGTPTPPAWRQPVTRDAAQLYRRATS